MMPIELDALVDEYRTDAHWPQNREMCGNVKGGDWPVLGRLLLHPVYRYCWVKKLQQVKGG
jgi:hypothetical protein